MRFVYTIMMFYLFGVMGCKPVTPPKKLRKQLPVNQEEVAFFYATYEKANSLWSPSVGFKVRILEEISSDLEGFKSRYLKDFNGRLNIECDEDQEKVTIKVVGMCPASYSMPRDKTFELMKEKILSLCEADESEWLKTQARLLISPESQLIKHEEQSFWNLELKIEVIYPGETGYPKAGYVSKTSSQRVKVSEYISNSIEVNVESLAADNCFAARNIYLGEKIQKGKAKNGNMYVGEKIKLKVRYELPRKTGEPLLLQSSQELMRIGNTFCIPQQPQNHP